jgi:hypothetical protein
VAAQQRGCDPARRIARPAGSEWNDDADGMRGIVICMDRSRNHNQQRSKEAHRDSDVLRSPNK